MNNKIINVVFKNLNINTITYMVAMINNINLENNKYILRNMNNKIINVKSFQKSYTGKSRI